MSSDKIVCDFAPRFRFSISKTALVCVCVDVPSVL